MFNLIPIALLIGALGGILYIVSNHLSELNNDNEDDKSDVFGFNLKARFVEWANQLPLDNIKSQSFSLIQKLLHRFRLALLKTDNQLMKLIDKISRRDKNSSPSDFWEDLAKNKDEKQIAMPIPEPELKIDFAVKNEAAKKFFDIQPAKSFSKVSGSKTAKKTLKIKKSSR